MDGPDLLEHTTPFVTLGFLLVAMVSWITIANRRRARIGVARVQRASPSLPEYPLVSIILPARNEASTIETCVRSLLAQDYPRFEIIAIDDCSEDGTGTILRRLAAGEPRLTVIGGAPLPSGWMGKAHAIVQGYGVARGRWLLFTDADTHHQPWLLTGVMARLHESPASFVTVFGSQRSASRTVQLINLAVFTGVWWFLVDERGFQDPRSPSSLVNGQYVMFDRQAYDDIGTHAAVRSYSSTDLSLGYLAKLRGWRGVILSAPDGLHTLMYRTALDACQGWSRSLVNAAWTHLGRVHGSAALVGAVVVMLLFWVAPWILLSYGVVTGTWGPILVAGLQLGAGITAMRQLTGWTGAMRAMAKMPASCLVLAALCAAGLLRAWRVGATSWKGRLVPTSARLPAWNPQPVRDRAPTPVSPAARTEPEAVGATRFSGIVDRTVPAPPV